MPAHPEIRLQNFSESCRGSKDPRDLQCDARLLPDRPSSTVTPPGYAAEASRLDEGRGVDSRTCLCVCVYV